MEMLAIAAGLVSMLVSLVVVMPSDNVVSSSSSLVLYSR